MKQDSQVSEIERICAFMITAAHDFQWLTLEEIADVCESRVASVSAQLRNLRKKPYGSWTIVKRHREVKGTHGIVWEYFLFPKRETKIEVNSEVSSTTKI